MPKCAGQRWARLGNNLGIIFTVDCKMEKNELKLKKSGATGSVVQRKKGHLYLSYSGEIDIIREKKVFPEFRSECETINMVKMKDGSSPAFCFPLPVHGWSTLSPLLSENERGRSQRRQSWHRRRDGQIGSELGTLWPMFPLFLFSCSEGGAQKVG